MGFLTFWQDNNIFDKSDFDKSKLLLTSEIIRMKLVVNKLFK